MLRCFLLALSLVSVLQAATPEGPDLDYYLPVRSADHDPGVPTPHEVLGTRIGEWHLHHHELVEYGHRLAEVSDRVTMAEYARSHGRRPLIHLVITDPANHARLEEIRLAHLKRADPEAAGESGANPADLPLVVWMGYGIHGNEPSASNAAPLLAYHLAAARDAETLDLLRQTIIIVDPCLNPDGFERFAAWSNGHRGRHPVAHRAHREHLEAWPGGRTNAYWFDLNRDWLPAVHPESRGRLEAYARWRPHVVTDYHEMGNVNRTYFFQPGFAKMVHPLTPARNQSLTEAMAREHAQALDALGSLYFTGEQFDDYYIGKGSTYADVTGSVGVLFEQASSRGYHQDTEHGRLTFPFTIRNQVTTSLSSLRSAHRLREEFIDHQTTFFRKALEESAEAGMAAHFFAAPGDRSRLRAFQELLDLHGIRSHRPAAPVTAGDRTFDAEECLVVPVRQARFRLLTALFETRKEFGSAIFYDVSAWHLPSAFGLIHAELDAVPEPARDPAVATGGTLTGERNAYAYVFSWEPRHAPTILFRLLEEKIRCWTATSVFQTNWKGTSRSWPHGSILIPVGVQDGITPAALLQLLGSLAREHAVEIHGVATGYQGGTPDLGSPRFLPVDRRDILLVAGPGVNSTTAGAIWHQFDRVWEKGITLAEPAQISSALLGDFTTVILADTPWTALPEKGRSAVQDWVARGGSLLAIGSGVASLAGQDWCKVSLVEAAPGEENPQGEDPESEPPGRYDEADERRAREKLSGVILRARFDPSHPLAFGLGERPVIELIRSGTTFLEPSARSGLNPLHYAEDPLVSGFASGENLARLRGTTPVQLRPVASGRVIYLTDNPVFRGHWLGSEKLLANAVCFGPLVVNPGSDGEESDEEP